MTKPNMVVSEYHIVNGLDKETVCQTVKSYLKTGWELHGPLCIHVNSSVWYFAQAMVKKTEEDTRGAWG